MTSPLNPTYRQAFVEGVLHTLKTMCHTTAECERIVDRKALESSGETSIAGCIQVSNKDSLQTISICFPESTYLGALEALLGERPEALSAEVYDGASEFMNIIFGHAKRVLNEKGDSIALALPRVVVGQDFKLPQIDDGTTTLVLFRSPLGKFHLAFGNQSSKETAHV